MLEILNENTNVWEALTKSSKPIVLYGMGNAAEKIVQTLESFGGKICDVFASDEFVRGHSFLGHRVMKYSEICEKYDDFNVMLGFASHLDNVIENIKLINSQHTVYAPDIPIAGGGLFTTEFVKENEVDFDFTYNHLADNESKKCFLNILNFKISGKIDYLLNNFCSKDKIYTDILKLCENETIVDLGAYDGDTIREFTEYTKGKYKHIYALEPDEKNFKKLQKNTNSMENITLYNMGAWNKSDTLIFDKKAGRNSKLSSQGVPVKVCDIDSLIDDNITMIKMDIEGSELHALEGCKKTILKNHPKLYVCAYHRNEDLFSIPKKILDTSHNYAIYLRQSPYIPAWECNFYCV